MSKFSLLYDIFPRQISHGYNMCPTATNVFYTSSLFCKWVNKVDVNPLVMATRLVTGMTFILFCIEYKLHFTVPHAP